MNNTANFQTITASTGAALIGLTCCTIIQNIFVLYFITKTPTFKSITGMLLLSQTGCDVIAEILMIILGIPNVVLRDDLYPDHLKIVLLSATRSVTGVTTNVSAAICFNLYAAICHNASYTSVVTQLRVNVFHVGCWLVNIALVLIQIFPYENQIKNRTGSNFLPNYSPESMWVWIVHCVIVYVIPSAVAVFSFVNIIKHSKRAQTTINRNVYDQIKLSKIIMCLTIWIISNFAGIHILRAVKVGVTERSMEMRAIDTLSAVFMVLAFLYHFAKLPMLALLYKPFRETMKNFLSKVKNSVGTIPQEGIESEV